MNSREPNINFQKFIEKTNKHDEYRGENYTKVFPEFSKILKEHGYK